jgi:hypothetical protein
VLTVEVSPPPKKKAMTMNEQMSAQQISANAKLQFQNLKSLPIKQEPKRMSTNVEQLSYVEKLTTRTWSYAYRCRVHFEQPRQIFSSLPGRIARRPPAPLHRDASETSSGLEECQQISHGQ